MNQIHLKKIIAVIVLLIVIGGLAYIVIAKPKSEKTVSTPKTFTQVKESEENKTNESVEKDDTEKNITTIKNDTNKVIVKEESDGTLYALSDKTIKPDLVIGTNFFDTQILDINTNFSEYEGKIVEIEGFYMEDTPYTFVGRYSESNLCAFCPQGYSYFEYEWHGERPFEFTNEKEWLKITGTLRQGEDEYGGYYYIDATSIKVMNERGVDTVKN